MTAIRDLLDKNKLILYSLMVIIAFLLFALTHQEPRVSIKPIKVDKLTETEKLAKENMHLRERLARLEPATPVKIVTADKPSRAIYALPALAVINEGTRVPFETIYEDKAWIRPDFEPYWHSKQGQYSSLPNRIHSSYHRLFVTPGTAGLWKETSDQCGIAELSEQIKIPVYDDRPEDTLLVLAIQHQVADVIVLDNQVVLLGTPSRTGLQILAINNKDLVQSVSGEIPVQNNNQEYLFQTVTPDGYEVDYSNTLISF